MNPPFSVDAIAFDLDGTLLDTIHDLAAAVNRLLVELGHAPLRKDTIRDLVGKGMPNLLARALALAGAPPRRDDAVAELLPRYQTIYGELLGRETVLFPGVAAALTQLRADGYKLAVITNKASRFVQPHLMAAGIDQFFSVVVGADDAERKKPDAAPMHLAARRLGVTPERMLMIGDSGNDVDAARAAGCPVLVVPYGYSEGITVRDLGSDGIVDSLVAIGALLAPTVAPASGHLTP
jgi:phosphoglycolate phosphatase